MIPKQKDYLHYLEQLKITRMLLISNLPASGIHGQKTQLLKWILTSITALRSTNAWYTPSIPKITFWWCGPSTNPISGVGGTDSTLSKFICLILKNAQEWASNKGSNIRYSPDEPWTNPWFANERGKLWKICKNEWSWFMEWISVSSEIREEVRWVSQVVQESEAVQTDSKILRVIKIPDKEIQF